MTIVSVGLLFGAVQALHVHSCRQILSHSTPSMRMAIEPSIIRDVAVYDSAMEAKLKDLEARVQSADWNAHQNRELVGKAQADLAKQEEVRKGLTAEVATLTAAKQAIESQLETKTQEVAKFVEGVESELGEARTQVKALTTELAEVKAELAERTTEVNTLNTHLEAHVGATVRLNDEIARLKEQLAAARAAAES